MKTLRDAGVHLVDGELWPLHEPGAGAPDRTLPWPAILDLVADPEATRSDTVSG